MKHRISHKKYNGHRVYRYIPDIRQVYLIQSIGGTISAIPMSGYDGTDVNLYNTADIGYSFDSYNITGANLTGNTFKFNNSDVTASPNWTHNVYNLTLETDNNGKLESNKNTGYYNDTASLTATPSSNYHFSGYTVTGGSINNNIFTWSDSNATAKAWFKYVDPYNPLGLPPYTLRLKYKAGYSPYTSKGTSVRVDISQNIWDLTYENNNWYELLVNNTTLTEVLGVNSTNVTSMKRLFFNCTNIPSVPLFDTSKVTNMDSMFRGDAKLASVPLFDTSKVTNMDGMFLNCDNLTSAPLYETSNVTSMSSMFLSCDKLKTIPLFNTSKVTNMDGMFNNCNKLTSVPLFDTKTVTSMERMFYECHSLTNAQLFDTKNVTNMDRMYYDCSSIALVPLYNTSKVTNMSYMFNECTNVQSGALALYQQASTQTNPPVFHFATFKYCGIDTPTGSAELAQIPDDWKKDLS